MFRSGRFRRFAKSFKFFRLATPRRLITITGFGAAGAALHSTLTPTALDSRWWSIGSKDNTAPQDTAPWTSNSEHVKEVRKVVEESAAFTDKCMPAYLNASRDPDAARRAVFADVELLVQSPVTDATLVGEIPIDQDLEIIFERVGIRKDDVMLWLLRTKFGHQCASGIDAIQVAANVDTSSFVACAAVHAALQFELDKMKAAGRFGDELPIIGIQCREKKLYFFYAADGSFHPFVTNPQTLKTYLLPSLGRIEIIQGHDGQPHLALHPLCIQFYDMVSSSSGELNLPIAFPPSRTG